MSVIVDVTVDEQTLPVNGSKKRCGRGLHSDEAFVLIDLGNHMSHKVYRLRHRFNRRKPYHQSSQFP